MITAALRAFALATFAWIAGLALAVVVGFALGLSFPGPAGIVGGAAVLGAIVGLAQKRIMRLESWRLVLVTSLASPLAFLAAAFVGATFHLPGLTAFAAPLVLIAQTALSHSGGIRPRRAQGAVGAAALGWTGALGALVVPGLPIAVRVMALAVPGMMAAIYFASAQQRKPVE